MWGSLMSIFRVEKRRQSVSGVIDDLCDSHLGDSVPLPKPPKKGKDKGGGSSSSGNSKDDERMRAFLQVSRPGCAHGASARDAPAHAAPRERLPRARRPRERMSARARLCRVSTALATPRWRRRVDDVPRERATCIATCVASAAACTALRAARVPPPRTTRLLPRHICSLLPRLTVCRSLSVCAACAAARRRRRRQCCQRGRLRGARGRVVDWVG
jgi:hypothetical protein